MNYVQRKQKASDEYMTPQDLYEDLDKEFHFNLDPCSTHENAKCEKHYTVEENGLNQDWGGCRVFCNPPYSNIKSLVEKCYRESQKDHTLVVMLIPARVDTRWFHDFIYNRAELRFPKGRIRFNGLKINAPFPVMIVIFRGAYI